MDYVSAGKPISKTQQISYSIATLGSSSLGAVISAFAFFFYVRVVFQVETGDPQAEFIKNTLIGAALAIGWWVEAIANPIAGFFSDRVASRFGRRILWLIIGTPVMAIGFIGIFNYPGPPDYFIAALWLSICMAIYRGAYGATVCVYLSIMPEIASTPKARTSLSSWRQLFYLIGTIGGTLIGALFSSEIILVYVLAVIMVLVFYITAFGSGIPRDFTKPASDFNFFKEITQTLRNKPFIPYVGFTILATMMQAVIIGSLALFGKEIAFQGEENLIAEFMPGIFVITAILGVLPAKMMTDRVGKRKATMISLGAIAVILSLLFTVGWIPGLELIHTLILVLLVGFPAAALLVLPDALISDITDYDESVTGFRREAMHFATQGILTRFAGGIAVLFMGVILGIFGSSYGGTAVIHQTFPDLAGTF